MARLTATDLPLRTCVGIMLINRAGLVWIGQRQPKWVKAPIWQMPQGGLLAKEDPRQGALRELREETGVRSVEIIAESPDWLTYELPPELIGIALKGRYRGQRQKWFAMRFTGPDSEINISSVRGLKVEFDAWRWAYASEAMSLAIPYKRPLYGQVVEMFSEHLAAKVPPRARSWSEFLWRRARGSRAAGA
ncbi:MAG: RNA pyrophosphohydrolase [Hyphomicrobiaceae bacterium]|nr:RNA pyrophosphohydrolase [Hyphomicrobiaceae bacterium]